MDPADPGPPDRGARPASQDASAETLGIAPPAAPEGAGRPKRRRRRRSATTGEAATAPQEGTPSGGAASGMEGLELPTRFQRGEPGARPGITGADLAKLPSTSGGVWITCIDYGPEQFQVQEVADVEAFVAVHRPEWSGVRWINVDGLTDMRVIHEFAAKYGLHPLAVEDLLQTTQRPKIDSYPANGDQKSRLFVIIRMLQLIENHLHSEQISIFLGHRTVLTFQETHGDVWDPIRLRLQVKGSRLRVNDASFLVYSLIDSVVDHCFPILEHYGDRLESLEETILDRASPEAVQEIHGIKRELLLLRRAVWPMRDVVQSLQRDVVEGITDITRTYLRDVYDHAVQVIDILETYRELCSALAETYVGTLSLRMNETIRVLTVLATIFTPITFLASVYGMNFQHFPELDQAWAYPAFWIVCGLIGVTMWWWFKRRHWL